MQMNWLLEQLGFCDRGLAKKLFLCTRKCLDYSMRAYLKELKEWKLMIDPNNAYNTFYYRQLWSILQSDCIFIYCVLYNETQLLVLSY